MTRVPRRRKHSSWLQCQGVQLAGWQYAVFPQGTDTCSLTRCPHPSLPPSVPPPPTPPATFESLSHMHRALCVLDLLHIIYECEGGRDCIRTLASTCHELADLCGPLLWAECNLQDIARLARLLEPGNPTHRGRILQPVLRPPLSPTLRTIFRTRLGWVRSLRAYPAAHASEKSICDCADALKYIAAENVVRREGGERKALLPLCHRVEYSPRGAMPLAGLHAVLDAAPTLSRLFLQVPEDGGVSGVADLEALAAVIRRLPLCRQLRELAVELHCPLTGDPLGVLQDAIQAAAPKLDQVHTVTFYCAEGGDRLLEGLALSPSLHALRTRLGRPPRQLDGSPAGVWVGLRTLSLCHIKDLTEGHLAFLRSVSAPALATIELQGELGQGHLVEVSRLVTSRWSNTMKRFQAIVTVEAEPSLVDVWEVVEPLSNCLLLEDVALTSPNPTALDDAQVRALSLAWPRLRSIHIFPTLRLSVAHQQPPKATRASLIALAANCRALISIGLSLNLEIAVPVPHPLPVSWTVTWLALPNSINGNSRETMQFYLSLFPALKDLQDEPRAVRAQRAFSAREAAEFDGQVPFCNLAPLLGSSYVQPVPIHSPWAIVPRDLVMNMMHSRV
ncbi:hypothetical protein CALCODRAFT_522148 [Calocera cornea HHB12733]|uniref:Uncharacterized protein n=1 Tax=Calocera cornea HHB12733 TaxID=1353952 RepID=A0A166LBS1_9BASI|nr:hypothetical protein CALCODRAFT_522148 [Calocera cornea HHB12733]